MVKRRGQQPFWGIDGHFSREEEVVCHCVVSLLGAELGFHDDSRMDSVWTNLLVSPCLAKALSGRQPC